MFPDLARDDVFRLETARLWLRWPRASDAAAIHRYLPPMGGRPLHRPHSSSLSAGLGRALHLRRARGQRLGARPDARDDARRRASASAIGVDQPRIARRRPADARLSCSRPSIWGKGLATEAARAMVKTGFALDRGGRDPRQRAGRERRLAPCARELRLRDRLQRARRARRRAAGSSNATRSA